MLSAIEGTLNYYINCYPQKRFNGMTCGQVREKALSADKPISYPIKKANKYISYWNEIKGKQERFINQIIESFAAQ